MYQSIKKVKKEYVHVNKKKLKRNMYMSSYISVYFFFTLEPNNALKTKTNNNSTTTIL